MEPVDCPWCGEVFRASPDALLMHALHDHADCRHAPRIFADRLRCCCGRNFPFKSKSLLEPVNRLALHVRGRGGLQQHLVEVILGIYTY